VYSLKCVVTDADQGIDHFLKIGVNVGHDFSGDIVAVGSQVEAKWEWKVGDSVAGCLSGGTFTPSDGAFQGTLRASLVSI
jgi:NADPH:quinone reductase-like Zn-dependent oxidoreductase